MAEWVSSKCKMWKKTVIVNQWYWCIWVIGEEGIRSFNKAFSGAKSSSSSNGPSSCVRFSLPRHTRYALFISLSHHLHLSLSVLSLLNIQTIHKTEYNVPDVSFARTAPKAFPLHRSPLPNLFRIGTTFATGSPLGTDSFYVYYPSNFSVSS